jgi:CHAT domain-containing protein
MHIWLARIRLAAGDLESADSLVNWTTKCLREESIQSGARRDWVTNLEVLAEVREANGDLAGSIRARREAVKASREIQGERHPRVASCLFELGRSLAAAEQFQESRETLENATTLFRELLGDEHPQVGACLCVLGEMDLKEGKLALATHHLEESARVFDGSRTRMAEGIRRAMGRLPSPYEALAVVRLKTGDHQGAWVAAERSLARCLADLLESAGKPFSTRAAEPFGLARIQAAMTDHDALVGWLETPVAARSHASNGHSTRWGYVVRNRGGVTWVPLEPGTEGESNALRALMVGASKFPLRVPLATEVERASYGLWQSRFAPLEPSLDGVRNLIVIPSGGMLGIPVEALLDSDGHYLGDRFVTSYTPSGTVLATHAERREVRVAASGALLIGDPLLPRPQGSERPHVDEPAAVNLASRLGAEVLYRSAAAGNADALDALPRLPGSRDEVLGIALLLPGALTLLGRDASELNLVAMAESGELKRQRILHFATHALVNDRQPERSALVLSRAELPDPLLSAERGTRFYDGLLTADEICREWVLDADLVTLSGCQTGLGRVTPGEGYLGFAHAFFQAGARSLLVSLWKVDDQTTARLMQRFYADLAGDRGPPMTKAAALREARIWLRDLREPDGKRPYAHPAYWAGFILLGDAAD